MGGWGVGMKGTLIQLLTSEGQRFRSCNILVKQEGEGERNKFCGNFNAVDFVEFEM